MLTPYEIEELRRKLEQSVQDGHLAKLTWQEALWLRDLLEAFVNGG